MMASDKSFHTFNFFQFPKKDEMTLKLLYVVLDVCVVEMIPENKSRFMQNLWHFIKHTDGIC